MTVMHRSEWMVVRVQYKFTIPLKPITKKNSQQIIKDKTGRPRIIQSSAYRKYEKQCEPYMPHIDTIDHKVNVKSVYYMPNNRRVDLTNLHEALHDILVHYGVLIDDNCKIIVSTDGSYVDVDKWNPRTEMTITDLETG